MDVLTFRESRPAERPRHPKTEVKAPLILEAAIERSQSYLLSQQKPEGYWVGELIVDATLVADKLAFHHWDGQVDEQWQRKAVPCPLPVAPKRGASSGKFAKSNAGLKLPLPIPNRMTTELRDVAVIDFSTFAFAPPSQRFFLWRLNCKR